MQGRAAWQLQGIRELKVDGDLSVGTTFTVNRHFPFQVVAESARGVYVYPAEMLGRYDRLATVTDLSYFTFDELLVGLKRGSRR